MTESKRTVRVAAIVLLVAMAVYAFVRHARYRGMGAHVLRPGVEAPLFAGPTLDGGRFDLRAQRGKPVVVTFWASHCRSCKQELPHLQAAAKRAGDRAVFVTVANDDPAPLKAAAARLGLTIPVVLDDDNHTHDAYDVFTIPYNVVIAPDGTVLTDFVGPADAARIDAWLKAAGI